MLALSRAVGQSIVIEGGIEVKVVRVSNGRVKLEVQAPQAVAVDRDEVWRTMRPGELTPLEQAYDRRGRILAVARLRAGDAVEVRRGGGYVPAAYAHKASEPGASIVLVGNQPVFVSDLEIRVPADATTQAKEGA